MACEFNMLDQLLPGAAPGGTWTHVGWNLDDPNGPWTAPPSGYLTINGDNPLVDTDTWDDGIHYFTYDDGINPPQDAYYWKKEEVTAGTATDLTVCRANAPLVDLYGQLSGNDPGNWSVSGNGAQPPSGSFDPVAGTFQVDANTPAGDYIFIFTAEFDNSEPDFTYYPCKVCEDDVQLVITVDDQCDAGTGGTFGISYAEGTIDLWDFLSGTPEQSIVWTQIAGDPVTISGDHLGTITDIDSADGCYFEFKAECDGGSGNACGDESTVILTRESQLNPVISEINGGNQLTVTHNSCPGASYEWTFNDGSGPTVVGTTQTIGTQGAGDYTVSIDCDNGCSDIATYTVDPLICDNDSNFTINFDGSTECIDVTADDSGVNSPIDTETWEYKVGNGAYQPASFPLCGCDIREFFDVNAFCQVSGSDFQLGYNSPSHCPDPNTEIDQLWIEWGDGTQTVYTGFLDSFQETVPMSDFLNTYNGQIKFVIKLDTPLADLFLEIQFTYTGDGDFANCADVIISKLNEPVAYRDITVKRTLTFSDGCPDLVQENPWNPPPNCLPVARLNLTNTNGNNTITATPYNIQDCSYSPTYEWYLDGNLLAGETGQSVNRDTYGYGTYTVIMTCGGCSTTDSLVWQAPCSAGVSISESGGVLTANATGCSGQTITYTWEYWDGSSWNVVGSNSSTHTPANNGLYRVTINCGTCSAVATYDYTAPCNVSVTISNPSGYNMTTNVTGCGGATINYKWFEWDGSAWVEVIGQTSSSYDPGQAGAYMVEVTCMGCQAIDTHTFNCNVTASITDNGNDTYTGNASGCSGTVNYLWERSTNGGGTWNFYSNNQTISDPPDGLYRLTVSCDGCSAVTTITITGCDLTGVNITVSGSDLLGSQTGCTGTVDWLWEYDDGSGFVFYGNTQNVTAGGNGDYRLTVTCDGDPNCSLSTTITYNGSCNNTVSVSYDPNTDLITATTSGCSGVETIQWQYSPNGGGTSCPGGGWINLSSGVYQITPSEGTGCYRAIVDCDGQCPTSDEVPVQSSNNCSDLSITYNSPAPNEISFGELLDNGTPVTNYLIKWVDGSGTELFRSAAGSFFDPAIHYPHPSSGVLVPAGDIKPIVIDSDVGQDLDCWNYITVNSYGCSTPVNTLNYDGIGGPDATTEITFEVDGSTDSVLFGLRPYTVSDKLEVIYDGVTLLDTGFFSDNSWQYFRVPYTYVSGEPYMTVKVTNNNPNQNTKYDLYANCCNQGSCPPTIPDPSINFIDNTCDCIVNASSFGNSYLRGLCLTVSNFGGGGTAYWNKEPPIQGSNCIVFSGTCEAGSPNMSSGTTSGSLVMPPTLYTELKTEIQANVGTDCFISIPFFSDAVCGGDANLGNVYLPLNGITYTFDDANDTINFTIDGNPYSNANSCTAEYRRWEEYEKVKNQSKSGSSAKLTQATAYNSGTINNQEADFSIFITGECSETRDFRLTWADVNCPCESWELREDTTGNGVYDTLIDSNSNWTGTCT